MFNKIFRRTAARVRKPERIMIDATASKGAPHGRKPLKKGLFPDVSGAPAKAALNSKAARGLRQTVGARSSCSLSEGQMSDLRQGRGADVARPAQVLARSFSPTRATTRIGSAPPCAKRGIAVCIPSKSNRKVAIPYDALPLQAAPQNRKHVLDGSKYFWRRHPHPIRPLRPHRTCRQSVSSAAVAFWLLINESWSFQQEACTRPQS